MPKAAPDKILFALLAAAALGVPYTALAQPQPAPELSFYPAKGWAIEKKGGSCVLGNEFNNGFTVRFAGSESWVQDINIDFRQDIFKPGKPYKSSLSVPGVKTVALTSLSPAPGILNFSLEGKKEFFKALKTSAVLDVSVEKNNFRFFLTGFQAMSASFERCMAGGEVKPAGEHAAAQKSDFQENEAMAMEAKIKADVPAGEAARPESKSDSEPVKTAQGAIAKPSTSIKRGVARSPLNDMPIDPMTGDPIPPTKLMEMGSRVKASTISNAQTEQPLSTPPMLLKDELAEDEITAAEILEAPATSIKTARIEQGVDAQADVPPPSAEEVKAKAASEPIPEPVLEAKTETDPAAPLAGPDALSPDKLTKMAEEQLAADADTAKAKDAPPAQEEEPETVINAAPVAKEASTAKPEASTHEERTSDEQKSAATEPVKKRISTPEMVVNREVIKAETDLREYADMEPAGAAPAKDETPAAEDMHRIEELEKTLAVLREENKALNEELSSALREGEKERLNISSDNWDLEQATMKFNEAERQIKRLGLELQKERALREAERKELEAMLFDPQVTNQAQLARLADLEAQLAKAKEEIEIQRMRYEQRIQALEEAAGVIP